MRVIYTLLLASALTLAACGEKSAKTTSEDKSAAAPIGSAGTPAAAPAGQQLPFCDEIGRRVSVEDCEDARILAKQAEAGLAAFNAPDPMKQGETVTLQLAVAFPQKPPPPPAPVGQTGSNEETTTEEATAAGARRHRAVHHAAHHPHAAIAPPPEAAAPPATPSEIVAQEPGHPVSMQIKVGRHMAAELSGDGFSIRALSPRVQEVTEDGPTTWEWAVTANRSGEQTLTLKTLIEGQTADGQWVPLKSTVHDQKIMVKVSWLAAARALLTALPGWIKLVAAVIAALTTLVVAWLGLRKALRGQSSSDRST